MKKDIFFQERLKETALDKVKEKLEDEDTWTKAKISETPPVVETVDVLANTSEIVPDDI